MLRRHESPARVENQYFPAWLASASTARESALHAILLLCDNGAMQRLMLTLDTPAANLALDEALLDLAEATGPAAEFLRIWESPKPMIVLGRSSHAEQEIDQRACAERNIPILRRMSGGASIVAGPGCLMYAVILSQLDRPELHGVPNTHRYVIGRLAQALSRLESSVHCAGSSD